MIIHFEDEYGEIVHQMDSDVIPRLGDTVVLDDEYVVKSITWYPVKNGVVVELVQYVAKQLPAQSKEDGRLTEANRAIMDLSKKQTDLEKKTRNLGEQLASTRKHIKQATKKEAT
jgi:septal ring factor EnvC (AmiA/AmiB activator)